MAKKLATALLAFLALFMPAGAMAACKDLNLVQKFKQNLTPAAPAFAAAGQVTIKYFGHSFFVISTDTGTRIMADPFGPGFFGMVMPQVEPQEVDAVTVGREHPNHNSVWRAKGIPQILRGVKMDGLEWNEVDVMVRDVRVYSVPIYIAYFEGQQKGSAFVIEANEVCIAHLGDLAGRLTDDQLRRIGRVDVALIPIEGRFTMDHMQAREVIQQLNPKIAIPMHYRDDPELLRLFIGSSRARRIESDTITISKTTLPQATEIVVLKSR